MIREKKRRKPKGGGRYLVAALLLIACAKKPPAPVVDYPLPGKDWRETQPAPVEDTLFTFAPEFGAIYFDYNSYRLSDTRIAAAWAQYLKQKGGAVLLSGHASEEGTEEYNQALGMQRAVAVASYLNSYGIPWERARCQSYGEEKPATLDPDQFHLNRRVEITLETSP